MMTMRKNQQLRVRFAVAAMEGFYMIADTLRLVILILPRYASRPRVGGVVVQCRTWDEWEAKGRGWALGV